MIVKQISIFLENRAGRLAEITGILGDHGINMRALTLADTADFGILRLIVDDVEKAITILKENGLTVGETDVIAIEVPDSPGGLAQLLRVFQQENVNVEYMYAFIKAPSRSAVMIFRFEDLKIALDVLSKHDIRTMPGSELYNMQSFPFFLTKDRKRRKEMRKYGKHLLLLAFISIFALSTLSLL